MKDLSKEIVAYALQNAIAFGKADASRVLPKLFGHGLAQQDVKDVMPLILDTVKKVNEMNAKDRVAEFKKFQQFVKEKVIEETGLPDLPQSPVGKKMVFRLAPFPSGALHLGNAKTYVLNALYAEKYGGDTLLVMDDTIGSSEKPLADEGYDLIVDAFKWLGVAYKRPVVYKSDRLSIYYEYAEQLIAKNKAYVCHCAQEALRENRAKGIECSCRHFPKGIQRARWQEMFNLKEGHAVLRIKTSMQDPNPAFRDRVLFKISDREHPRVGTKYRVWPSLEMSWAIDDHLLGVTHIIRGNDLAMETQMEQYIWDIFKWKHPVTIHTGLIRIEGIAGAKISKSKAQKEVLSGEFIGWEDPRTWSIQSLAARGIAAEAVRVFVEEIGLNKQDISVPIESLYAVNRKLCDANATRYSFVAQPQKIVIDTDSALGNASVPLHPDRPEETRTVPVSKELFIAGDDFTKFEGKEVRLLHLFNVKLKETAKITDVENKKGLQKLNWVSSGFKARVLMPTGDWVEGLADTGISDLEVGDIVQFERFGFVRYNGEENGVHEFWFAHK